MIGSEREALTDLSPKDSSSSRISGPLATLGVVLAAWIIGRAALWEDPFSVPQVLGQASQIFAADTPDEKGIFVSATKAGLNDGSIAIGGLRDHRRMVVLSMDTGPGPSFGAQEMGMARAHEVLYRAALQTDLRGSSWRARRSNVSGTNIRQANVPVLPGSPPFIPNRASPNDQPALGRWSLGVWAFGREGSQSAPISEGRVPVYGASQLGANLQYRIAPANPRDPRAYLRAYRALIERPENELAFGVSARPAGAIPVRVAAEVRATENQFGSDIRPAVLAITEVPPVSLPWGFTGEVYAGAGYVGGESNTAFVDGQGTIARRVASFDLRNPDALRVSVGAGAWGGAQRDAHRIDVGPTLRLDMSIGELPARFSIDYRERVGGDAAPESGVAATLSTQF
ncbi:MAG: hypothetical protein AAGB23_12595 [Pseudomonadota bacterium]